MQGLLKHPTVPHRIEETEDKGRGVFANAPIKKGKYVCEYKTTQVYKREQRARHEEEYATNMEACMILEAQTKDGWICLDATRRFGTVGRLMNHAPKKSATVKPFKPLKVNGKWRVPSGVPQGSSVLLCTSTIWLICNCLRAPNWLHMQMIYYCTNQLIVMLTTAECRRI